MLRFTVLLGFGLVVGLSGSTVRADAEAGKVENREIPPKLIEKFDKNGDGKLDDGERSAMRKAIEERRGDGAGPGKGLPGGKGGPGAKGAPGGKPGPGGKGGPNEERRAELTKRFDKNGDGKVDESEREALRKSLGGLSGKGPAGKGRPGFPKPGSK